MYNEIENDNIVVTYEYTLTSWYRLISQSSADFSYSYAQRQLFT